MRLSEIEGKQKYVVRWYVKDERGKWQMYAGNALVLDAKNERDARKKAKAYLDQRYPIIGFASKEYKLSSFVDLYKP